MAAVYLSIYPCQQFWWVSIAEEPQGHEQVPKALVGPYSAVLKLVQLWLHVWLQCKHVLRTHGIQTDSPIPTSNSMEVTVLNSFPVRPSCAILGDDLHREEGVW